MPEEDQGYLIAMSDLPDGASVGRTHNVDTQILDIAKKDPSVKHVVSFSGFTFMDQINRSTFGSDFIVLKPWGEREEKCARHAKLSPKLTQHPSLRLEFQLWLIFRWQISANLRRFLAS